MRPTLPCFAAALLACSLAAAADEPVKLEHKYPEGSKVTEQKTVHVHQVLTLAGMDVETDVDQVITTKQTVKPRKADGSTPIEVEFSSMKVHMALPGGVSIDFDSADPPKDVDPQYKFFTDAFKALSGARYTFTVDARGKVQSVEGSQSILDKANDLDPKAGELLQSRLSPETLKRAWEQDSDRIPDILVRPGEPWTRSEVLDLGMGQTMTFGRKFEYAGTVEKDGKTLDKIQFQATGVTYAQAPDPKSPVSVDKSDLKIKSSAGTLLFDRDAGRVVESTESTRITGSLTLTVNGMAIPADLDLTLEESSGPKVD